MKSEAINPILNKVGQFLSSSLLRNILWQPKNSFSLRWIMDNQKIFIVNLSKWKIGEDGSGLLGSLLVTKFQLEAMSRANIPEKERKEFSLYVDEFQNFATESFSTILSEARKYKLSLTMANQYVWQMSDTVKDAVFWNVWTTIAFQVWYQDALFLGEVFGGGDTISSQDLMNLPKYSIYLKLLVEGMPTPVFSANTFSPFSEREMQWEEQSFETLLRVSREKYTKPRSYVENMIAEFAKKLIQDERTYQEEKSQKKWDSRIKEDKQKIIWQK